MGISKLLSIERKYGVRKSNCPNVSFRIIGCFLDGVVNY